MKKCHWKCCKKDPVPEVPYSGKISNTRFGAEQKDNSKPLFCKGS
jgi:hypothetical protein